MHRAWILTLLPLLGCEVGEEPEPTPAPEGPFTFIAMGDPQYGGGSADKNTFQVEAMNRVTELAWREELPSAGEPVSPPRGVLIAGDLTQNGQDGRSGGLADSDEIGAFEADYGLVGGDGALRWPVYEGYGNHDFDPDEPDDPNRLDWRDLYDENATPAVDRVAERNGQRLGLTRIAGGDSGHYSWDWGELHLVNLNLFPGDEASDAETNSLARPPRGALSFLREDLEAEVGDSGRPIVLMAHYGFDAFSREPRWWQEPQREAFLEAIEGYDVIAYLHGHAHATFEYDHQDLPVLCVGSPYYAAYNDDGKGHFTLLRFEPGRLEIADVGWTPEAEGTDPHFTGWWRVVQW